RTIIRRLGELSPALPCRSAMVEVQAVRCCGGCATAVRNRKPAQVRGRFFPYCKLSRYLLQGNQRWMIELQVGGLDHGGGQVHRVLPRFHEAPGPLGAWAGGATGGSPRLPERWQLAAS